MNIQLTISLLASDRPETLRMCLDSLKPLLRELDSELVIVFTGKEESTLELIRQYTPYIVPFTWCNDFSRARNAGLREAKGEWFLYLDDDEWFEDVSGIIHFFKSGEYRQYQSATYVVRNYRDLEGKRYLDADVGRMCRRTEKTEFKFPVHESLNPFDEPVKKLDDFVHHFGYATRGEPDDTGDAKSRRNLPLLLARLGDDPDSPLCHMQLAQEYKSIWEYGTAIKYCRKGLELARKEERVYNYELWLQVNLPLLLVYTGEQQLAREEGERILAHPRTLEVGCLHVCTILTDLCWDMGDPEKGLEYVRLFHKKLAHLWKHPEKAQAQRAAGITMEKAMEKMAMVYMQGLFFAAETGDFQSVCQILPWFPWEDPEQMSRHYPRLEEWKRKYQGNTDVILEGYARLNTGNIYVCLQKMLHAERKGNLHKAEALWEKCARACPPGFQWELIEAAVRCRFPLSPLLGRMSPEAWDNYIGNVTAQKEGAELESFYGRIQPLMEGYPFYARRLGQRCLEKRLAQSILEPQQLVRLLHEYAESVLEDASALYKDEVLSDPHAYALPSRYRFAAVLGDALQWMDGGDYGRCIPLLKEMLHAYPQMSVAVSQLSRYLESQMKNPPKAVSEEFAALGGKIKQALCGLMGQGQWEEAYGVTAQLVPLLPDDLEVLRMKQEILRQGTQ